ncbi:hypothetical protein [Rhodohalobacter sp. 614A]|uniref:hypothetical protein n=1 Tax=Rhodohalobacter sp. 614A TaxID=2908649 RepID=UPI001F2C07BD|nr:hypothetical protein [Rhodohalobacter sp. 614A]
MDDLEILKRSEEKVRNSLIATSKIRNFRKKNDEDSGVFLLCITVWQISGEPGD